MKIVQVSGGEIRIPIEQGGGSEEYIYNISRCLAAAGHNVIILDRNYDRTGQDEEDFDGVKILVDV